QPATYTLSLHDALPIYEAGLAADDGHVGAEQLVRVADPERARSGPDRRLALPHDRPERRMRRGVRDQVRHVVGSRHVARIEARRSEEHTSELQSREKLV